MPIHPKVATATGGAFGGAELGSQLAGILIWVLSAHGVAVPPEQVNNITGLAAAVVGGLLALTAGWFTVSPNPPPPAPAP